MFIMTKDGKWINTSHIVSIEPMCCDGQYEVIAKATNGKVYTVSCHKTKEEADDYIRNSIIKLM